MERTGMRFGVTKIGVSVGPSPIPGAPDSMGSFSFARPLPFGKRDVVPETLTTTIFERVPVRSGRLRWICKSYDRDGGSLPERTAAVDESKNEVQKSFSLLSENRHGQ